MRAENAATRMLVMRLLVNFRAVIANWKNALLKFSDLQQLDKTSVPDVFIHIVFYFVIKNNGNCLECRTKAFIYDFISLENQLTFTFGEK